MLPCCHAPQAVLLFLAASNPRPSSLLSPAPPPSALQRGNDSGPGAVYLDGQPLPLSLLTTTFNIHSTTPPAPGEAAPPAVDLYSPHLWLSGMGGLETLALGAWYDSSAAFRGRFAPGLAFWRVDLLPAVGAAARCAAVVAHAAEWLALSRAIVPEAFGPLQSLDPYVGAQLDAAGNVLPGGTLLLLELGLQQLPGTAAAYIANVSSAEPSAPAAAGLALGGRSSSSCSAGLDLGAYLAQASQLPEPLRPWGCTAWAQLPGARMYCLESHLQDVRQAELAALRALQQQQVRCRSPPLPA
jgi:hypothetical protein